MANQADVYIKNELLEKIHFSRKLPDGSSDLDDVIAAGEVERIYLPGPDVSLVIDAPRSMDIKTCPIKAKSDVDLHILCSRTYSNWTIKIIPNGLPPHTPTSVHITIGGNY